MLEGQHNGTDRQRSGVSSGKKFTGRQVLGKIEELGDLVYKIGCENQADMFIRTTEGIADYVGVNYGWDLRMLVKNRVEPIFTRPVHPTEAQVTTRSQAAKAAGEAAEIVVSSADMAEFKAELDNYHRDTRRYREDKAKVLVVILGQCSVAVRSWLENTGGLTQLEVNRDVLGLLAKLEEMAFSTGGVQDLYVTVTLGLKRLTGLQQGPKESVARYHKRFMISAQVLDGHWGNFFPTKFVKQGVTKEEVQDRLQGRMLLLGADKGRFGSLIEDLNNKFIGGTDNYPKSLEATLAPTI